MKLRTGIALALSGFAAACSAGPLEPAPAFDAGDAPRRELPHVWIDPVRAQDAGASAVDASAELEPDAHVEPGDGCAPRCAGAAGTTVTVRSGRMAYADDDTLFVRALPSGEPEAITELAPSYGRNFELSEEHLVYADDTLQQIVVRELESGDVTAYPYGGEDGRIAGAPSIDGTYIAYALDLPPSSSHAWADETEVFVLDLSTGKTRVVGPHVLTIQMRPIVRGARVLWVDDRRGHHDWDLRFFHQFELMSAALPEGDPIESLLHEPDEDIQLVDFDGSRALVASSYVHGAPDYGLLDLASGELSSLKDVIEPGDSALALHGELLLLARKPVAPAQCYLRVHHLERGTHFDVTEPGQCPIDASTDGTFIGWTDAAGPASGAFFGDLRAWLEPSSGER